MSLEIYRLMASMMNDGNLVVITGRRKPHPSPTDKFPCLAYVIHDRDDGSLLGNIPGSTIALTFLLSQSPRDKGYLWRLPTIDDVELFKETELKR